MGYTRPGTSKFSLGVDTSAESLKSDVKKKIAKDSGKTGKLGVDMTFDHDKIKADATKSSSSSSLTPGGNVPMGSAEDIAEVKKLNPSLKDVFGNSQTSVPELAASGSQMDHHRIDMENKVNDWKDSKLKNISRGHYMGDMSSTTNVGQLKTGGEWNPVTKTETYGNITKPKGSIDKYGNKISSTGTGFIPKGKGSTVTSYQVAMEDEAPEGYGERTIEAGDYQGYVAPEKTGKQKRQANRKERKEARYQKQSKKSMDIALKRQAKQENK
jgi:hypothetical protein